MRKLLDNLPDILYERDDGAVCYRGTGVKFYIFVNAYKLGHSPGVLTEMFGTLEMGDVLQLIDCYLENRVLADEFVAECNRGWDDQEIRKCREWQGSLEFQSKRDAHIEKKKRLGSSPYERTNRDAVEAST